MKQPIATAPSSIPPAATDLNICFWCKAAIGTPHKESCGHVIRRAKIRVTLEYEVNVHGGGDPDAVQQFEFRRNEGSWCANNIISELQDVSESSGCLCNHAETTFVSWVNEELKESR